jgi:hypothetical protein
MEFSGSITLLVALIAASVALVGIVVQQRSADRHRFTDRKQALYVDFWIACQRHRQAVANQIEWRESDGGQPPTIGSTEAAERTLLAMDLVANEAVAKAARTLFKITVLMGARFARGADDPPPLAEDWAVLDRNWQVRAKDFLELARYDLRNAP